MLTEVPSFSDRRFCAAVFDWVRLHDLLRPGQRGVLAVSGGLDSMVMLDWFRRFAQRKYGCDFVVAHLDHALRPDSADDARWLQAQCAQDGMRLHTTRLTDLPTLPSQSSQEARARSARYDWLLETARLENCSWVATAHSASDQAETLLMRLVRGGVSGLGGMAPQRALAEQRLIRPLLGLTRPELEAYARHHGLHWREDSSNQSADFFRNRVRQQLLPWLLEENPRLVVTLAEHAALWRDEQDWLRQEAEKAYAEWVVVEQGWQCLPVQPLLRLPLALQRLLLKEILTVYRGHWRGYTHRHLAALLSLAAGAGGKRLCLPGGPLVEKRQGSLFFQSP
ncbi:MAG: tRNA lysidine(34) synthetase TilS [Candidatus Sericytochromatia bacterium]